MSEQSPNPLSLGCWFKPLLLGIASIAAGVALMDRWATLTGPLKALSVALVSFGTLTLLPVALYLVFKLWMRRLKRELGDVGDHFKKIAEQARAIYSKPPEYREAVPQDFATLDTLYYEDMEAFFKTKGFRTLGDRINQSLQDLGKPSPPIRTLISSGSTIAVGIYHLLINDKSIKMVDLETEFSDSTFLVTANSATLDLSTPPPGIVRHQLEQGTAPAMMLDTHESEMTKLTATGKTCVVIQTLAELFEMQQRMHALKNAARAENDYVDNAEVRRVAQERLRAGGSD
jgi:hypothetical protein